MTPNGRVKNSLMRPFWRHSRNSRLSPRFRYCHYFQKMAVRILEVDASPATAGVELAVRVIVGPASVRESLRLHPAEDRVELRIADVKGVVMALAGPGIETRLAPSFGLVGEGEGQALV